MSKLNVLQRVILACSEMSDENEALFEVDANERSITHQLAIHLTRHFPEYDIDCEYNRNNLEPKKLDGLKKTIDSDDLNATTVYPDIIVHRRRKSDNLIVIEAKKRNVPLEFDRQKLKLYKSELGYKYAYLITFSTGALLKASERFNVEAVE